MTDYFDGYDDILCWVCGSPCNYDITFGCYCHTCLGVILGSDDYEDESEGEPMVLKPVFVDEIPSAINFGDLYISRKYSTATHLCPCGCGGEVVTPLKENGWSLTVHAGGVSLSPSIECGWSCHSHYWITDSEIRWA